MFDYATLRVIWWVLLGVLLIGFAVTDGFDLGVATLLPFVARTDVERRIAINSVGPTWEGNQVWFILGGGAIFAAWPFVYAVSFSGFYLAMFLVLASLILRPVGFKYRSKRPGTAWRHGWDWALFVGGAIPTLVFGVAVGNVLRGVPFRLDDDLRAFYDGNVFGLFTPFTLLCGLLSVAMIVLHGASWLTLRIENGPVQARARRFGTVAGFASLGLFAAGGVAVARGAIGYALVGAVDPAGPSNPRWATSIHQAGAWLGNFEAHYLLQLLPALGLLGAVLALIGLRRQAGGVALGRLGNLDSGNYRYGGGFDVSLHLTKFNRCTFEPAGVECIFERPHARHHGRGNTRLPAIDIALHKLGLPGAVGRVTSADVATNVDFY